MCLARAKLPSSTCIIHSLRHDQGHLPGTQFLGLSKFNFWALRVLNCLRLLLVKFDFGERLWKRQGQKCLKETCLCNSCCSKWYKMVSCRGIPWLQEVLQEAGSNAKSIRNCTARLKAPYAKDNKQIIGQRIVKERYGSTCQHALAQNSAYRYNISSSNSHQLIRIILSQSNSFPGFGVTCEFEVNNRRKWEW